MKKFIYRHFKTFLIIFSILSLTSVTSFWWLSLFSMIFFIWNFFNEKKKISLCIAFLSLTVVLNIFNFTVIKPTKEWGDKVQAEWDKTGYDETKLPGAQEAINVIARSVEEYRFKHGAYPVALGDINDIFLIIRDYSYRIKEPDGQINGILFNYERIDSNKFHLAGVGKDGIINTEDDLLPQISSEQEKTTGLLKFVVKSFSLKELDRENRVIEMFKKGKQVENY